MRGMEASTETALLHRIATEQAGSRAPSLVAGVVRGGELVWSGARGFVGGQRPGNGTQYRLGSITKSMVAALVMRLRDEGKISLSDPLEKHVPGTAMGHLTIAQLLSHTSGVTAESPGTWWERAKGGDWTALDTSVTTADLKHRPGSRFHYSNVGYGALGELVARVRGKGWFEALREEVLFPLGMDRTEPHPTGEHAEGWAVHPFADVLLPEPSPDAGAMAPAGQLWATIPDLARWTAFVGGDTGDVLNPATMAEMRELATVDDGDVWNNGFGLGLQLMRFNGRRLAGHSGSMPGFLATALVDEATGTGAVAMANSTTGVGIVRLAIELIDLVERLEPALPTEWRPSEVDPALLALTGLWHWGVTPYHLRVLGDGKLNLAPANGEGRASRFRHVEGDDWLGLDGYYAGETLHVGRSSDGTPAHLDLATFIFSRTPYDTAAPIPGGVDPSGWRAE